MRPVDLVIPDAGPLISLARAGRLDLIEVFERPVAVLDVVRLECLKKVTSPDHLLLRDWFDRNTGAIRIIDSPILPIFERALRDEAADVRRHATRGLGDAAFAWLLPNIDEVVAPGTLPLILTEDRNLSTILADQRVAHILSTRAWLLGLENAGVIASAREVIEQIGRHGRILSSVLADMPAASGEDRSDWVAAVSISGKRG